MLFWNDNTFTEIGKVLGTIEAIDAKRAKLQVSINVDQPLQFERRVGFPNGDTGKVSFAHEGLFHHCFNCQRISHEERTCQELTEEQKTLGEDKEPNRI